MQFHKVKFIISLLLSLIFVNNVTYAKKFPAGYPECWQDTKNPIVLDPKSSNQFCPLNSKVGHRFFLVDFTSPLAQAQIDWISGRIFGSTLIKETPPYQKVSFMKIDDTAPQSQKLVIQNADLKLEINQSLKEKQQILVARVKNK